MRRTIITLLFVAAVNLQGMSSSAHWSRNLPLLQFPTIRAHAQTNWKTLVFEYLLEILQIARSDHGLR